MTDIAYVDENDLIVGAGPRKEAFQKGIPHRSVRIFLVNNNGEVLIARRAASVAVHPGRWGESVAGHVDAGEDYEPAALREAQEELGIPGLTLIHRAKFYTELTDERGTVKRFNTLFTARYDGPIHLNFDEVSETRWINLTDLGELIKKEPQAFTPGCIKGHEILTAGSN